MVAEETIRLIKDISYFNQDYIVGVQYKTKGAQSIISPESLSQMVLNIESNIKTELALILDLVLRLPTSAPRDVQVLKDGERGVRGARSSKDFDNENEVVFGKEILTQIPTSTPMKHVMVS